MASPLSTIDLDGATVIRLGSALLLVDCPDGLTARWQAAGLPPSGPLAILFTEGGAQRIGGLYRFLAALREGRRHERLTLLHSLTDERVGHLVGAFLQGEGADYEIELDADLPGGQARFGPFRVELRPAPGGIGFRIHTSGPPLEIRSGHDA